MTLLNDGGQVLNAPVVGNVESAPGRVIEGRCVGSGRIAALKSPAVVEG